MATPRKDLSDGIITGSIKAKHEFCANCGESVWCVEIEKVELPETLKPSPQLIVYQTQVGINSNFVGHIKYLGLTCGCYAKFHRQLAHILHSSKKKS